VTGSDTVLIVDDEEDIIKLLQKTLRLAGFNAQGAATGEAALVLMRENLYSIVLCDIRLPDIDGKDLIRRLKELHPLCVIIMMTGYSSMENVVGCLGHGAEDYFTKPFRHLDEIVSEVRHAAVKLARWRNAVVMKAQ